MSRSPKSSDQPDDAQVQMNINKSSGKNGNDDDDTIIIEKSENGDDKKGKK